MRFRRSLLALAIAALVSLCATATADASATVPKLLRKFQPVLVLYPGEEFRPTTVESFVRDSNLEAATSPTTWVIVNPSPDGRRPADSEPAGVAAEPARLFRRGTPLGDLACYVAGAAGEPGATVYGRVARDGRNDRPPVLALLLRRPLSLPVPPARSHLAVARRRLGGRERRPLEAPSGRSRLD